MAEGCKKFRLDLTDYAGGDRSQITNMNAFEKHLKTCKDCGGELRELQKTLGVLIANEPRSEQFQKKMSTLKRQIYLEEATRLLVEHTLMLHYSGAHDWKNFDENFNKVYRALVEGEKYNDLPLSSRAIKITESFVKDSIYKNVTDEQNLLAQGKLKGGLEKMFKE